MLFHNNYFLLAGKHGEQNWERFKEGITHRQKAYVDSIDPAEIKPERRKVIDTAITEKEKSMLQSSLSTATVGTSENAEVQAQTDAEQELLFTRLQLAEFLGYPLRRDDVMETVKRVPGVPVVNAESIYDNMYGAAGPLGMEENRRPSKGSGS